MSTLQSTLRSGRSALLLTALLSWTACQDADSPAAPQLPEPALTEAALDGAAQQIDQQQESNVGQADRQRQRDGTPNDRGTFDRIGLAVDLAASAVDLATEILAREGADERQRALLAEAERFLDAAEAALRAGDTAGVVRNSQAACWTALKAWILPGGVTREEAEAVRSLATELLTEAAARVGDDAGIEATILGWAAGFYTHGAQQLDAGNLRGVVGLWKAAALSFYLI